MNSVRRVLFLLLLLVLGLAAGLALFRCNQPGAADWGQKYALDQLALSPDQEESIAGLEKAHQVSLTKAKQELAQERVALSKMMAKPEWDMVALKAQCKKVSSLQCAQQEAFVEHLADVKATLSAEQSAQLFGGLCCELCGNCSGEGDGPCVCDGCGS
jgi:Spy/CpxP family protein refolding chaperone